MFLNIINAFVFIYLQQVAIEITHPHELLCPSVITVHKMT